MATRVNVSVLFSDLVGSTATASRLGAAAADELRTAHFGLLGDAIAEHAGSLVKTLGDGVMAVFSSCSSALDAAISMQQAIHRHNQCEGVEPLSIRIGVTTGDCTEDGGDYFGEPVVQAARLCDQAAADEILVSAVIGMLVPRNAYELGDAGSLPLKGLPEPLQTCRLAWAPSSDIPSSVVPLPARLTVEHLAPLVGRGPERAVLAEAYKAARHGERRVVLLTGEAGLGKTRLTADLAAEAFEDGALVLYGRCDEELAVPYLPWVESLDHFVTHAEDELEALDPNTRDQLTRLLPDGGERDPGAHGTERGDGAGDQLALLDAVGKTLAATAARRPTVVILDDLHWADDASLLLLRHVASSLPHARLLLVGTYRDTDLVAGDALTETSARLHRVVGVQRVALTGLSDTEVVELLEGTAGHAMGDRGHELARSLRADSAGNPFFVTEVLRHLVESGAIVRDDEGAWTVGDAAEGLLLPQSVRDVVGQRVRRLGRETSTVLTAAAVVGRDFDGRVVAGATDFDEDVVLDVLDGAIAAGLVAEVGGIAGRYTFTHALVQHTLYEDLSEGRRARMHHRVATAIEEIVGEDPGSRVGELARHWFAAVRPSELDRAIGYAVLAGRRALVSAAPGEAIRWFEQALEAVPPGQAELQCTIETQLGEAERRIGREGYRERLLRAAGDALALGRDDLLVDAAISNYRGLHSISGEVDTDRVAVLEQALASKAGSEPANRARLLATKAGELTYGEVGPRIEAAGTALDIARTLGDSDVVLDALERVGSALNVPYLLDERLQRTQEALDLTVSGRDPLRRFFALDHRAQVLFEVGDMAGTRHQHDQAKALAEGVGEPTLLWLATTRAAQLELVEGNVEDGMRWLRVSAEIGEESGQPDAKVFSGALSIHLQWHLGRFEETVPMLRQATAANPGISAYRPALAIFLARAGDCDGAQDALAPLVAAQFELPQDLLWLTSSCMAAEAVHLVGDARSAEVLYDRLLPYASQTPATRVTWQGAVAHYLGLLAATLGHRESAATHLLDAMQRNEQLRSQRHLVQTQLALADLWSSDDPNGASRMRARAVSTAQRYGIEAACLGAALG